MLVNYSDIAWLQPPCDFHPPQMLCLLEAPGGSFIVYTSLYFRCLCIICPWVILGVSEAPLKQATSKSIGVSMAATWNPRWLRSRPIPSRTLFLQLRTTFFFGVQGERNSSVEHWLKARFFSLYVYIYIYMVPPPIVHGSCHNMSTRCFFHVAHLSNEHLLANWANPLEVSLPVGKRPTFDLGKTSSMSMP